MLRLPRLSSTNRMTAPATVLNVDAVDLCFRPHSYRCWLTMRRITVMCWSVVIVISRVGRPEGQPVVGFAADRDDVRTRLYPPYSSASRVVSRSLPGSVAEERSRLHPASPSVANSEGPNDGFDDRLSCGTGNPAGYDSGLLDRGHYFNEVAGPADAGSREIVVLLVGEEVHPG